MSMEIFIITPVGSMDIKKKQVKIQAYVNTPPFQFWFEDGILHMWTTERSGLFILALDEEKELHFLADVYHKPKEGTVYEFQGIYKTKRNEKGQMEKI